MKTERMHALELLVRGLLAGLAISAPVGPVNALCISRTLSKGRASGVAAGLGAATADTIYGAIAGFSITFIISFLLREQFWIRLFGGMVLVAIGVIYWRKQPQSLGEGRNEASRSDYASAFLLNLTNPTTVLSFLAVLAVLGAGEHRATWLTLLLVAGIFAGAMLWWLTLTGVAHRFRARFDDRAMRWVNRIAGFAISGFGVATMILSRVRLR